MKNPSSFVFTVIMIFFVCTCRAEDPVFNKTSNFISDLNPDAIRISCSVEPELDTKIKNDKESTKVNKHGIISGSILIICGAALGYTGQKIGNEYYSRYKKSAFTENTDLLRKQVVGFNVLRIGGACLAGAGVLVFVFSF